MDGRYTLLGAFIGSIIGSIIGISLIKTTITSERIEVDKMNISFKSPEEDKNKEISVNQEPDTAD
jgi:hypothetical protein